MISPTSTPDAALLPHLPPLTTRAGRTLRCDRCRADAVAYRSGEAGAVCARHARGVEIRISPPARAAALQALQAAKTEEPAPPPEPRQSVALQPAADPARPVRVATRAERIADAQARAAAARESRIVSAVEVYQKARAAGKVPRMALIETDEPSALWGEIRRRAGEPGPADCADCRALRPSPRARRMCPAHAAEQTGVAAALDAACGARRTASPGKRAAFTESELAQIIKLYRDCVPVHKIATLLRATHPRVRDALEPHRDPETEARRRHTHGRRRHESIVRHGMATGALPAACVLCGATCEPYVYHYTRHGGERARDVIAASAYTAPHTHALMRGWRATHPDVHARREVERAQQSGEARRRTHQKKEAA